MASTATIEQQARDPTIRYDRQVRLWGVSAQAKLAQTQVCLLGASAAGTEALKNLILPGIKGYTIVDDKKVTSADLGTNFFVDTASLGQPRAQVTSALLQELNELVEGNFLEEDPVVLINDADRIKWFLQFSCVVVHNLRDKELLTLANFLAQHNIALFSITTNGFLATLRVQAPELCVTESKPDNTLADLRLNDPWPELADLVQRTHHRRTEITRKEKKHTPFVVVLIHEWARWKEEHGGSEPTARERYGAFKQQLREAGADVSNATNFPEAIAESKLLWAVPKVPDNVQVLLDDEKATALGPDSSLFWILVRGLREFVAKHNGYLPLSGSLPDMTADTKSYLALQQCFNEKATRDREEFVTIVNELLSSVGRETVPSDSQEIELFCKNAREIRVYRLRSIADELHPTPEQGSKLNELLQEPQPNISWYLSLRAAERFRSAYNRYPGEHSDQIETDVPLLKDIATALTNEYGIPAQSIPDDFIQEICRFGGSEIHTISALIGGAVAQEVIKIVAGPVFTPLNNTFLFCGIDGVASQFEA